MKVNKGIRHYTKDSPLESDFFQDVNQVIEYSCSICTNVPNPHHCTEASCCGHLFCTDCITKWLETNKTCPFCKGTLKDKTNLLRNIEQNNKLLYRILQKLLIICPNKCGWKGEWSDLEGHLNECTKLQKECMYKRIGCTFFGPQQECKEHEIGSEKHHLELAMKFINGKSSIQFDIGEVVNVSCHPHPLTFESKAGFLFVKKYWFCDGEDMPGGCLSGESFHKVKERFRCDKCDFDLCPNCVFKYYTPSN